MHSGTYPMGGSVGKCGNNKIFKLLIDNGTWIHYYIWSQNFAYVIEYNRYCITCINLNHGRYEFIRNIN